jgi:polyhydroxyalkanoate synthesis regulator phasin
MKKKYAKLEDVAELVSELHGKIDENHEEVGGWIRDLRADFTSKLDESEQRLLGAIRGIEVRKQDVEGLQAEVRDLGERVTALEKKRGSRR